MATDEKETLDKKPSFESPPFPMVQNERRHSNIISSFASELPGIEEDLPETSGRALGDMTDSGRGMISEGKDIFININLVENPKKEFPIPSPGLEVLSRANSGKTLDIGGTPDISKSIRRGSRQSRIVLEKPLNEISSLLRINALPSQRVSM